jgi:hypothetical protein
VEAIRERRSDLLGVLTPIEEAHLHAQQREAPAGHLIAGPFSDPPYFRCLGCAARWSAGFHPAPQQPNLLTAGRRRRDESPPWHDI